MKDIFFKILNLAFIFWISITSTWAGNPCLDDCNLGQDKICLKRKYLCGQYHVVVEHLSMQQVLSEEDRYYLGAAYYGLYHEFRDIPLKCLMVIKSRNHLQSFLTNIYREEFEKTGRFADFETFSNVRSSLNMIAELKSIPDCLESTQTKSELIILSRMLAQEMVENSFLDPSPKGGISDAMIGLNETLGSFVGKSSEFETKYKVKVEESKTGKRYRDEIIDLINAYIGKVTRGKTSIKINNQRLSSLADKNNLSVKKVSEVRKNLDVALGNITPMEFEEKRVETVMGMKKIAERMIGVIDVINQIIEKRIINDGLKTLKSLLASDKVIEDCPQLEQTKELWIEYMNNRQLQRYCKEHPKYWFCLNKGGTK